MLKDDGKAIKGFSPARDSSDPAIAAEATKAYRNLKQETALFRSTVWVFPVFSTRCHDPFGCAQANTELRVKHSFLRPYLSVRLVDDARGAVDLYSYGPQYLSERAVI